MTQRQWSVLVTMITVGAGLWPGASARAEPEWNACAMMQKADLDAAFSPRVFEPGAPGREKVTGSAKLAAVSSCTFTSRGGSGKDGLTVTLVARRAPSDTTGVTPAVARAGAIQLKASPVDLVGLGEGAYWVNMGSSAFPVIQLNVFRGRRDWLVFGAAGKKLDTTAALAGLTTVARATAARP